MTVPDTLKTGVMLIHGLGRTRLSMWPMARRLRRAGWEVVLVAYPSLSLQIEDAAGRVAGQIADARIRHGWDRVHLVGHSLGGLIARRLAVTRPDLRIARVVQMGSPNAGTPVAGRLDRWALARWVLGPVLSQVAAFAGRTSPVPQVGAIGGTADCRWLRGTLGLHGVNDGLVPLRSAWAGAGEHVATPVCHTALPASTRTARLVAAFLETGRFAREIP